MVDFKADLRCTIIELLERYHVKYKRTDDLDSLLIRLYTFLEKYISPQKRKVLISEELLEKLNTYPQFVQNAFEKLAEWVEAGVDINCFQGRGLYGWGSRDYQNMLYGIVHLHLSANKNDSKPVVKKDGFAKPGQYILFAYFSEAQAYFIEIIPHPQSFDEDGNIVTEWISKNILSIIEHNWPILLSGRKIENAYLCDETGNRIDLDDKAIASLTSNHISTAIPINGSLYMPGLGMMSSGDSAGAVLRTNHIINNAVLAQIFYEKNKKELYKEFAALLKRHSWKIPNSYDIHYEYIDVLNRFLIVDRNSGAAYDCKTGEFFLLLSADSPDMQG